MCILKCDLTVYRHRRDKEWPSGKQCFLDFAAACNTHLRGICIQECDAVNVEVFGAMLSHLKHVKSIELLSMRRTWPSSVLQMIADHCAETLERFAYTNTHYFRNDEIIACLTRCKPIRTLGIYGTTQQVTTLRVVLKSVPGLRELDLRSTYAHAVIGSEILQCIADHGRSLEVFNLTQRLGKAPPYDAYEEYEYNLTSTTPLAPDVAAIVRNCENLRVLGLGHDQKAAVDAAREAKRDVQVKLCHEMPKSIYY